MKTLIIEDEHPASQKLIRLLKETDPGIEIIDILPSVEQTINWFDINPPPDLIFMDIQLEDGLCFDIFENYKINIPVIFTTAYDEYTLKAFKVNSIDYLLKPIVPEELKNALNKYNRLYCHKTDYKKIESLIKQLQPHRKERFLIKIGEHYKSIPTSDIRCFYITERCTFLLNEAGRSYPVDYSLEQIEQFIDPKLFFRVNRNFIISYNSIRDIISYSSNRLKIILNDWTEKDEILVSRERVAGFKKWMDR